MVTLDGAMPIVEAAGNSFWHSLPVSVVHEPLVVPLLTLIAIVILLAVRFDAALSMAVIVLPFKYATARRYGFSVLSPYTMPSVIAVAEAIPFIDLTAYSVPRLYELKGEIVSRGVAAHTGLKMPVFPKRRFQHGALPVGALREKLPFREAEYRRQFLSLYR